MSIRTRIERLERRRTPQVPITITVRFLSDDDGDSTPETEVIRLQWPNESRAEFGEVRPKNNGT